MVLNDENKFFEFILNNIYKKKCSKEALTAKFTKAAKGKLGEGCSKE